MDAITHIGAADVYLDCTAEHVTSCSPYDPALVDRAEYYHDLYTHYGIPPFWAPGYIYPPMW